VSEIPAEKASRLSGYLTHLFKAAEAGDFPGHFWGRYRIDFFILNFCHDLFQSL
jgi:hypothetical protein